MANSIVKTGTVMGVSTIANLIVPGSGAIVAEFAAPAFDVITGLFNSNKAKGMAEKEAAKQALKALNEEQRLELLRIMDGETAAQQALYTAEDRKTSTLFKRAKFAAASDPNGLSDNYRSIVVADAVKKGEIKPELLRIFKSYAYTSNTDSQENYMTGSSGYSVGSKDEGIIGAELPIIDVTAEKLPVYFRKSAGDYYFYVAACLAGFSVYCFEVLVPTERKKASATRKRNSALKKARAIKKAEAEAKKPRTSK